MFAFLRKHEEIPNVAVAPTCGFRSSRNDGRVSEWAFKPQTKPLNLDLKEPCKAKHNKEP